MKNGCFYERNRVENGEWTPEKQNRRVMDLRRSLWYPRGIYECVE